MANVEPGEPVHEDGDRITEQSANGAGTKGDCLAVGANGDMVLADGSNGFAGIQGSDPPAGGGGIAIQKRGMATANVEAGISKGDALEVTADANLGGVGDGSGGTAKAGPGDIRAESDESGGVAEVYLP